MLRAMETLCTLHTPISGSRGMTADCDGFALVCCVYEEGVGWVVKRSKTGAGFTTLFSLNYMPSGCAASNGRLWVSSLCAINEYNAGGECLRTIPGHSFMSYMESCENVLYFIAFLTGVLCAMDTTSGAIKVMANHVKSIGGMAVLPAAQKLLFISSRNSLCQLDLQSRECRVITPSLWPEGGRLLTGNDQLALLIVPCTGGSNFFSCSVQGELRHLRCVQHSAVSPDYRLNSRGDLLFFERRGKELARLSCLPALLPPAEATACKIVWPKGGH